MPLRWPCCALSQIYEPDNRAPSWWAIPAACSFAQEFSSASGSEQAMATPSVTSHKAALITRRRRKCEVCGSSRTVGISPRSPKVHKASSRESTMCAKEV
jgi:hypothetical protein